MLSPETYTLKVEVVGGVVVELFTGGIVTGV
jgi:hypothetical protein